MATLLDYLKNRHTLQFAERSGISRMSLNRIAKYKAQPNLITAMKIFEASGHMVTPMELLSPEQMLEVEEVVKTYKEKHLVKTVYVNVNGEDLL
jgi:transcriptional regulator with XRE-family HTH domain